MKIQNITRSILTFVLTLNLLCSQAQNIDKKKVDKDRGFGGVKLGMTREQIPHLVCGFHDYTYTFWWCRSSDSEFSIGSVKSRHTEFGFFGKDLYKISATIARSDLNILIEELTKKYGKPEYIKRDTVSSSDQYYFEWRGRKTNLIVMDFGKQHPISVSFNMNDVVKAHKKIMKKMDNDPDKKEAYEEQLDRKSVLYKSKRRKQDF